jgi:hypothetical protein
MGNNKDPNKKRPGEKEPGTFHYNPGNTSGKAAEGCKNQSRNRTTPTRNKSPEKRTKSAARPGMAELASQSLRPTAIEARRRGVHLLVRLGGLEPSAPPALGRGKPRRGPRLHAALTESGAAVIDAPPNIRSTIGASWSASSLRVLDRSNLRKKKLGGGPKSRPASPGRIEPSL